MSDVNSHQVGGSHYQGKGEQHWDIMIRLGIPYTLACATKYLWRWRNKNGIQDLEKALHYLQKTHDAMPAILENWYPVRANQEDIPEVIHGDDRNIIFLALNGKITEAIQYLEKYLKEMKEL